MDFLSMDTHLLANSCSDGIYFSPQVLPQRYKTIYKEGPKTPVFIQ